MGEPEFTIRIMFWWQTFFLSVVQGLTEFLPISSSGHLVIFQKLFGLKPPILFDVFVHVGTLGAVLFYFRKALIKLVRGIFKKEKESWYVLLLIVIGTIPAAIVGLLLEEKINLLFDSFKVVGSSLLITSLLLFLTILFKGKLKNKKISSLKWKDVFFVGLFQALAILPGVSRSGATISAGSAGLFRKLNRNVAFQLSFFLAIPAILGALILQIPGLLSSSGDLISQALWGMVIAGIVGYFALKILKRVLVSSKLWLFGVYCFFIGLGILIFS